ncbi:MAG: hypothetical protein NC416_02175 [Eubacterium sp.]|nr:hypothetical protein [Eubacterium sp.]
MYINDLGIGRVTTDHSVSGISSTGSVSRISSVNRRNNLAKLSNTASGKTTDYATVMKNAVESERALSNPTFATAGDIIIQEAFKKMETDPEWEESVMDKVKDYYAGDYVANSAQTSYQNLLGSSSLQNYLIQSLIGGTGTWGLGLTGNSSYGISNLAASAYGSVMNSGLSSSLFGDWQL